MANWKCVVNAADLWKQHEDGEVELSVLATEFAKRLLAIPPGLVDDELKDLVEELLLVAPTLEDANEFDFYLDQIYDWADDGHRMWIKTF